jgi:hypothetical protein
VENVGEIGEVGPEEPAPGWRLFLYGDVFIFFSGAVAEATPAFDGLGGGFRKVDLEGLGGALREEEKLGLDGLGGGFREEEKLGLEGLIGNGLDEKTDLEGLEGWFREANEWDFEMDSLRTLDGGP